MSFKSRTPKKEECVMSIKVVARERAEILHCHNYEQFSDETKRMIDKIVDKANKL